MFNFQILTFLVFFVIIKKSALMIEIGAEITREQIEEQGFVFDGTFGFTSFVFKKSTEGGKINYLFWDRGTQKVWANITSP
jgi:hypothetical protein